MRKEEEKKSVKNSLFFILEANEFLELIKV